MICINCSSVDRKRVGRLEDGIENCSVCGGGMRACAPERLENMLAGWASSRDPKDRGRVQKNAELLRNHGFEAILCLMARGLARKLLRVF